MTLASQSWRQSYAIVLLGTVGVVAAADYFIYRGAGLGWTAALVAGAMLFALAVRDTRFLTTFGGRVVWLASIGLLFALVEQPTWLNVLYALVCVSTLALINSSGWTGDFVRWLQRWLLWAATAWSRVFLDNGVAMRWLVRRGLSPTLARGVAAWVIPVLLSLVFVGIFALANPIISGWIGDFGTWLGRLIEELPELLNPARILFWSAFAMLAWGLLRSRTWRARRSTRPSAVLDNAVAAQGLVEGRVVVDGKVVREHNALGIPAGIVIRCLILFNLIFAVENVLDLWVLYGGHLGSDATAYKTYVRRGAYPLVAAALLAGAFVLVTFRPRSETERSPAARKLVYVWIAQTILLTASAAWRLMKYVDLSELTRLRVASTVWFVLVALGLIYIVWRIVRQKSNAWLINANALTALVILYPCCFVNFDGIIADFNAKHCEEAGGRGSPLDIEYFRDLGTPALPAFDSVRDRLTLTAKQQRAEQVSQELRAELEQRVNDWRSWTWRRHRTARELESGHLARGARPGDAIAQLPPPAVVAPATVDTAGTRR
jgi:hypothetical protein